MIDAHSSVLHRTIEAIELDRFISSEKARCRDGLSCRGCGARAYFTGRSRNGRAPYFGARHNDDCELEAAKSGRSREEALPEADQRAPSDLFAIVAERRRAGGGVTDDPDGPEHQGNGRRHTGNGPVGNSTPTHQIGALLWKLMRDEVDMAATVRLPDGTVGTVAESTVATRDVLPMHAGKTRIYWGSVMKVEADKDGVWLRFDWQDTFSVRLRHDKVGDFLTELGLSAAEEFAGYHAIFWAAPTAQRYDATRIYWLPTDGLDLFAIRRNLEYPAWVETVDDVG